MPVKLTTHAFERGTYIVTVSFTNEKDQPITPKTVKWSLTDRGGAIINNRKDQKVTPDNPLDIVLKGTDLAVMEGEWPPVERHILIEATYDSDLGNDLILRGSAEFMLSR